MCFFNRCTLTWPYFLKKKKLARAKWIENTVAQYQWKLNLLFAGKIKKKWKKKKLVQGTEYHIFSAH